MTLDISDILDDWPYDPGQVTARRIRGTDGRQKIQLRLDLGLLQMEVEGRPDGERPNGYESLLDFHHARLAEYRHEHGDDEGFSLDERDCELLRSEGMMYYHRYLAAFILEDFEAVKRDATRNLRLFDFCRAYAKEETDRYLLEQYRPYVIMMFSRSSARIEMAAGRPKSALSVVRKGMEDIHAFYRDFGHENLADVSGEVAVLNALAAEIQEQIPVDPVKKLRAELAQAVEEERYEDAADLRDQLRHATGPKR